MKAEFETLVRCPRCKKEEQELLTDGKYHILNSIPFGNFKARNL